MNGLAQFECVAEGNPPPSVFWSKEGSQVSSCNKFRGGSKKYRLMRIKILRSVSQKVADANQFSGVDVCRNHSRRHARHRLRHPQHSRREEGGRRLLHLHGALRRRLLSDQGLSRGSFLVSTYSTQLAKKTVYILLCIAFGNLVSIYLGFHGT